MLLEEWRTMTEKEKEAAEEIVRIERDFTDIFAHCKDRDECIEKYKELYKALDASGDYEKMKYLWKVIHRLNIQIKK